jgi:hypothetical protein
MAVRLESLADFGVAIHRVYSRIKEPLLRDGPPMHSNTLGGCSMRRWKKVGVPRLNIAVVSAVYFRFQLSGTLYVLRDPHSDVMDL